MNETPTLVDARGLACPLPVLKTKEHLEGAGGAFRVMVDNQAARENVARFARQAGCQVESMAGDGCFTVVITPGVAGVEPAEGLPGPLPGETCLPGEGAAPGTVMLFGRDVLGEGERELGLVLMKSFLFTCVESNHTPGAMIFLNSGVRLVTGEETASLVRQLEKDGVEVVACGTCLDYYGLKQELAAGRIGNMYEIHSMIVGASRLVSI